MHKMLHPKADVQRLYIPRKDGGRDLIEVKKSIQNSNNRARSLSEAQRRAIQVHERERSKANISITKNANKFTREVTMPEFENREDKSLRK